MAKGFINKDAETIKDFALKAVHDLDVTEKVSFLEQQVAELKKMLWRERVNLVLSQVVKPADEAQQIQQSQQRQESKNNVKHYATAIAALHEWLTELKNSKEYKAFEAKLEKLAKTA